MHLNSSKRAVAGEKTVMFYAESSLWVSYLKITNYDLQIDNDVSSRYRGRKEIFYISESFTLIRVVPRCLFVPLKDEGVFLYTKK